MINKPESFWFCWITCQRSSKTNSRRLILKKADLTGDLIANKTADKIMKVSKYSQENNSETVTNKHDKEILKERYISSEEKKLLMTWD